ncbi:MAG: hypothetical protein RIT81_22980, partial [Deltaproteobacteria bacterium]
MPPALSLLLCASVGLSADDPTVRGRIALLLVDRGVDVFAASGSDAATVERRGAQYVLRWAGAQTRIDASVPSVAELELAQRIALGAPERPNVPSTPRVFLEARGEVPLAARARAAEAVLAEGLTLTGRVERAQQGRCLLATPSGVELRRGEPGRACRTLGAATAQAPSGARGADAMKSAEESASAGAVRKSAAEPDSGSAAAMKSGAAPAPRSGAARKSGAEPASPAAAARKSAAAEAAATAAATKSKAAPAAGAASATKSAAAEAAATAAATT